MISVAVLIALMIVAVLCAAMLKVGFARRHQLKGFEHQVQADWLLESGIDRAVSRIGASSDYQGETWSIPTEDFGGRGAGVVSIKVQPVVNGPPGRRIEVTAEYFTGPVQRSRRSQTLILVSPTPTR